MKKNKLEWSRERIKVEVNVKRGTEKIPVDAWVFGVWGIHSSEIELKPKGKYVITHVPSSLRYTFCDSVKNAKRFVEDLETIDSRYVTCRAAKWLRENREFFLEYLKDRRDSGLL